MLSSIKQALSRRLQGSLCQDGERAAQDLVGGYYQGDCNNALNRNFARNIKLSSRRKFSDRGVMNWKDRIYNECARDEIERELERVGRECLGSSTAGSDCNSLGKEVARLIVRQAGICMHRCYGGRCGGIHKLAQFHHACRQSATNKCEGFIRDAAEECGGSIDNVSQENELADKCEFKVYEFTKGV